MSKMNTLFNYFNKTPAKNDTKKRTSSSDSLVTQKKTKTTSEKEDSECAWQIGDLVWGRMEGYPWWPCLICNHPTRNTHHRKKQIHVQFFDSPPSRGWIKEKYIKEYTGSNHRDFQRGGTFYATDPDVNKGVLEADEAMEKSREERLELVVAMDPSSESESEDVAGLTQGIDFDNDLFDAEMDSDEENKPVDVNANTNKQNKDTASSSTKKSPVKKTTPAKSEKTSKRSSARQPKPKRRRIIESGDEDISEDDYKPDSGSSSEDNASSGDAESEPEPESEPESPQKGKKRKRPPPKKSQSVSSTKSLEPVSTPSRDSSGTPSRSSSFTPSVSNTTISKLASFAKAEETTDLKNEEGQSFEHVTLEFLKPNKIRDGDKRSREDLEYNPRTLHVPDNFLSTCTPCMRQWWEIKRKHFDTVLFFKMGKFYELFHMDAVVAVNELGLIYMRGNYAHSGFPEIAYGRYADSLIQKGYKVARIEQTETPAMMDERVKMMNRPTKYDKVVKRELCSVQTKGTKRYSFIDGDSSDSTSRYLLAVAEKEGNETGQGSSYGVCFVDTSIGKFHVGQFDDDRHCSRFRTLVSHYPPAHILYERGGLSEKTYTIVHKTLVSALKDALRQGSEFWDSTKTLKKLSEKEYFVDEKNKDEGNVYPTVLQSLIAEGDTLGHTAADGYDLAVRALGAIMWFTGECLMDEELFSMKNFELYKPLDTENIPNDSESNAAEAEPLFMQGRHRMVLDGVTLANLDILENSTTGSTEGSLLEVLDQCSTPFGKRLLKQWLCAPLCNPTTINERLDAVDDLIANQDIVAEVLLILRKLPDLERQLQKIHTLGSARRSATHPDGRAIFFEDVAYSKRKIEDFLSTLSGFKSARSIIKKFKSVAPDFKSKLLRQIVTVATENSEGFPDLTEELEFFDNAFDHEKAKKEGTIKPRKGVDEDFDNAQAEMDSCKRMLDDYLDKQRQRLGCKTITYWGTGKNRFQMEIPESVCRNVPDEYIVTSTRKGFKRYRTKKIENLLAEMITGEENKEAAIKDIMRRIFYNFDKSYEKWSLGIQCLAVLDVLCNLAQYSRCGDGTMCRPVFITPSKQQQPCIVIREGRHPCISKTFSGGEYIPNDTVIGTKDENEMEDGDTVGSEARVVLVTGPNMGGKSTLMRQAGLIVVLSQLGCYVPAEECRLTPVDRVFTRLGASDRIMAGESTFFVELSETSSILQHATAHSLVLMDELGRGTATYDGTAIACAVLARLSDIGCRTLFSTHYHSLVDQFSHDANIRTGHMACMVENENEEDPTQETITFLYKFIKGACPKSYGFNAARLADIPDQIISVAHEKARDFQASVDKLKLFRNVCKASCIGDLKASLDRVSNP